MNIRQRAFERLLRLFDVVRRLRGDGAHFARGRRDPVVTGERRSSRLAQRMAYGGLPLDARRDFLDMTRDIADFDAELARLRGDMADNG